MSVRGTAPVSGNLSSLLQPTPVEVLCDRTDGAGGMRGAENAERHTALGGGAHQFVRAVAVLEQMALVCGCSGTYLDGAFSAETGRVGSSRTCAFAGGSAEECWETEGNCGD